MKAIMLMFDSLKKDWLPPYGGDIVAPNFERLAKKTVRFDRFYVGSLPCMPARRELHTGRYNFLHRGWGPLEPFDDSMPQILGEHGVYTHLVSDHHHYWREGGANYHGRYSSYEHIRGQEGDTWKGEVNADFVNTTTADQLPPFFQQMFRQDTVNRKHMPTPKEHCQTLAFDAGLEFIQTNLDADRWFLQLECFDPHEPFFTYDQYQALYKDDYQGKPLDWPMVGTADQAEAEIRHLQNQYRALVSMIDENLGRLLDMMDEHNLWEDTLLIVNADHGLLLGEHDWWSKGAMPTYSEIANIPFFVWDPRAKICCQCRQALAQNIDVAASLLDFFGVPLPPDMEGRPLLPAIIDDTPIHEQILFGYHGGACCVTDGRYVYMRGPASPKNAPLNEYTLIPARMNARADVNLLKSAELAAPFAFTKGLQTLKVDMTGHGSPFSNMYRFGSRLYDLQADPQQRQPIDDPAIAHRLVTAMIARMQSNDAPPEQYERLALWEGMTQEDLAAQRRDFAAEQVPPVLTDLPWAPGALSQLKTLQALTGNAHIFAAFAAFAKETAAREITSRQVRAFAGQAVPKPQLGMAMMMLKLAERLD